MATQSHVRLDDYLRSKGPIAYSQVGRIAVAILRELDRRNQQGVVDALTVVTPRRIVVHGSNVGLDDLPLGEDELLPYLSPEAIESQALDVRSTLYSLGCTIYELLTGEKPFPWDNAEEIRHAHLSEAAPDPRRLNSGVPSSMSNLVRSLMEKDPALRPETPIAALATLQASLGMGGQPAAEEPEPEAPRAAPGRRSPRKASSRRGRVPARGRASSSRGGARAESSRTSRSSSRRAPARSSTRRRGRVQHEDDYDDDGSTTNRYTIQKKKPIFMYGGIVVGAFISIFVLIHALRLKNKRPEFRRTQEAVAIKERTKEAIKDRKLASELYAEEETTASRFLQNNLSRGLAPTVLKNVLDQGLLNYAHTPSGVRMAEEFLRIHAQLNTRRSGLRKRSAE